ncbi:MAG: cobalt-precorrin-5B (C(1))-methyltransferase CbiD [Methanomassiliicoccaceae archaeon]|nr:cobalt-precorrin-5B (C(1))-methyltransferase CbiD [Methanomassiliicoccaceae archaeon]
MERAPVKDNQADSDGMYVDVNGRRLRCGHTTGTCAAAASKMAAYILLGGEAGPTVDVVTPNGARLTLGVEDVRVSADAVSCAVRKDGGDDIDATHGMLIYSTVARRADGRVVVEGGEGIGRVTRGGLDQPVGEAAINSVPRRMITEALEWARSELGHPGGLTATISAPEGEAVSKRTFNPRLGIVGGISIIGTSGIVEPMSESALVDTIKVELRVRRAAGDDYVLVVPGNYGKDFWEGSEGAEGGDAVKCSNFVGDTIDMAALLGFKGLLLVGNLGKAVKLAGGVMNTHSRWADCRMEILSANSALAGAGPGVVGRIMSCVSTDEALDVLKGEGLMEATMGNVMARIAHHLSYRAGGMQAECIVFSTAHGRLGATPGADGLAERIRGQAR